MNRHGPPAGFAGNIVSKDISTQSPDRHGGARVPQMIDHVDRGTDDDARTG